MVVYCDTKALRSGECFGAADLREQCKLFSPQAAKSVAWAHRPDAQLGDLTQDLIPCRMAVAISHCLEMIDIEPDERRRTSVPAVACKLLLGLLEKSSLVEHSCYVIAFCDQAWFHLVD